MLLEHCSSRHLAALRTSAACRVRKSLRGSSWLSALVATIALASACAHAFNFDDVAARAKQLAAASYKAPSVDLPNDVARLTYDQFRDIRYRPDRALWRSARLPFELTFFHQGSFFKEPVKINEMVGPSVREVRFDPNQFDYGANNIDPTHLRGLSYAGFRVHFAINTPKYKDEVLVFLGASYFRALGKNQRYGLSARGLAVDTGLTSGEEFPRFVEFWIERPGPNATELVIYGLLDSRRMAGAYRFVLKPGTDTVMEIKTRLFLRENVTRLGIAPLTTMYFFGDNQHANRDDYRPEVHDSDGLSIQSGTGEWIWRPLVNPKRLLVTSFALTNPLGFGLMQRDRDFAHYEDLEARYDLRPSAWVEPKGNWGAGRVELVQIPSPDETNDNIVAYWAPDTPPPPQQPLDLEYRVLWQKDNPMRPPSSWVAQTRRGRGYVKDDDGSIGFVVDFDGPAIRKLPADAKLEGLVSVDSNATVSEMVVHRNDVTGGWRMNLRLKRQDENKPVELRAHLRNGGDVVSETWSYILPPG
jgi:glucans biosynthesis protein